MPPEEEDIETGEAGKSSFSPSLDEQNARDAMVAAAEAAMEAENTDGDDDAEPKPKPRTPKPPPNVEEEEDEGDEDEEEEEEAEKPKPKVSAKEKEKPKPDERPLSKLQRDLQERDQRRRADRDYNGRVEEANAALERAKQGEQHVRGILQRVQQKEQDLDRQLEEIRRNPATAMQKLGWKPDDFIDAAMREKDPNYQAVVGVQSELRKRDQQIEQLTGMVKQLVEKAQGYDQQTEQAKKQGEVQQLFAAIPETSPAWTEYEDEDDMLYAANKARRMYHKQTGKVATAAEIGEYLHYKALQKRQGTPATPAGSLPKKAGKTKAKGSRALGNSDSMEHRSSAGKTIRDVEGDEERQFLIDVADAAIDADVE